MRWSHWELDASGQPTNRILPERRKVEFITPIPKPKKRKGVQREMVFDAAAQALETEAQQYDLTALISGVRQRVGSLAGASRSELLARDARDRAAPAALAQPPVRDIRLFFCQVEAVET